MLCQRCKETPGFHSFESVAEVSGTHFFYCFPAHNKESVRTREDMLNFVSHFPTDRRWSLVFHTRGYGLSNMMPLSLAIEMGKLVQEKHINTLQKIYVIEGSWFMNFLFRCIFPFIQRSMREKFVLIEGSLLEVMTRLREDGLTLHHLEMLRNRFGKN
jgi:hypothetical protein